MPSKQLGLPSVVGEVGAGVLLGLRGALQFDALAAHERGELEMILPTICNLEAIAHLSKGEPTRR